MSGFVFGRWLFSHEEDGVRVYRPRGGEFAPSRRPRDGFDIGADGTFRSYAPGAADAPPARDGRWTAGPAGIQAEYDDGGADLIEIVDAAPGVLKVRRS